MTLVLWTFFADEIIGCSPRERVYEDIHILAYLYHWGFEECMNMPSSMRRVFADRALRQNREENKAVNSVNSGKGTSKSSYKEGW